MVNGSDLILLVEPMIPALRRYARGFIGERTQADDLVQDCLERVVRSWHQRRSDGEVRSWVFTILHNLAVNRMLQTRRRGRHVPLEDAGEEAFTVPAPQEQRIRHGELMAAVAALPQEQRAVLLLVSVEDLSYAETAKALDIPIGTVMSRLARAREKVAGMMETGVVPARGPLLRRVK